MKKNYKKTRKGAHNKKHSKATQKAGAGNVCSRNINDLLLGDLKQGNAGSGMNKDISKLATDLKRDYNGVKKMASGNWLASPGPPPKLDCTIL